MSANRNLYRLYLICLITFCAYGVSGGRKAALAQGWPLTYTETQKLNVPQPYSIAIDGPKIVVGTYDFGTVPSSHVYVFNLVSPAFPWLLLALYEPFAIDPHAVLSAGPPEIAMSGNSVVHGTTRGEDYGDSMSYYGLATFAHINDTGASEEAYATGHNLGPFGQSVAIGGESYGMTRAAVLGHADTTNLLPTTAPMGVVYFYKREKVNGVWLWSPDGSTTDARFGSIVAMSDDANTIVVSGADKVFGLQRDWQGLWGSPVLLDTPGINPGIPDGSSIAINEDGSIIVVGAPYATDSQGKACGKAYIFERQGDKWSSAAPVTALPSPETELKSPDTDTHFGRSVAASTKTVAIGEDFSPSAPGWVNVYQKTVAGWGDPPGLPQFRLKTSDRQNGDEFGRSVALDGNVVVALNTHDAYVYHLGPIKIGDSNLDGSWGMADLNTVVDHLLWRFVLTKGSLPYINADVNADGQVDMADINLMVDCLLGRIDHFPHPDSPSGFCTTPQSKPVFCATDVTAQVTITRSGFTFNFTTGRFHQTVTLKNKSASTISGPISLALDNLSSNARLYNNDGNTSCAAPAGSPYRNVCADSLSPGASVSVVLQFMNPSKAAITYNARVLDGSGTR